MQHPSKGNLFWGSTDVFVVKYNSSGTKQWAKILGSAASYDGEYADMIIDSSDNIYIASCTAGSLYGTNAGSLDLFLVKLNTAGTQIWIRQAGSSASDIVQRLAVDSDGNIFVSGYSSGNLDGNTNVGSADIFIVKYDSEGNRKSAGNGNY